ncbi:hypothetical protein HK102_003067 [Quaeritorhiza haematococci]|nr:hypothetical protein HK102_003067 [Quaeritorhiza haematococci]
MADKKEKKKKKSKSGGKKRKKGKNRSKSRKRSRSKGRSGFFKLAKPLTKQQGAALLVYVLKEKNDRLREDLRKLEQMQYTQIQNLLDNQEFLSEKVDAIVSERTQSLHAMNDKMDEKLRNQRNEIEGMSVLDVAEKAE